jgi:RHS repeat-associated protein
MLPPNPTAQDIFLARLFEEPLVPVGADPTPAENAALANALLDYSKRSGPDDFSSLTGFLELYPNSPWNVALLTNLGLEYYHTGHYSKTLEVWGQAWELGRAAADLRGKAIVDRAVGELAYMHARLGQMEELDALLKSVEGRVFSGPATERMVGAREGLWNMQNRPEIAFRCGPFALHRIKLSLDPTNPGTELIHACASTQKGFSLLQIEELSQKLGLYFQMAYRETDAVFVVPSLVHLKLDHFAAITRQKGDRYLLQDPTFGNDVWVTREALEAETSGYFLIPRGELAHGWRTVKAQEAETVRGKGSTSANDPDPHGPCDPATPGGDACSKNPDCKGMAVPRVHLMPVSLNINDVPVGYSPPVGPAVRFTVRYNQREFRQPSNFAYSNFGPKWTFDWLSYITDNPLSPLDDVKYYIMGGGTRTFTGFDGTVAYAFQQFDQTKLIRTPTNTYVMLSRDGTRKVFSQSDGSIGSSRKIFLTQLIDSSGNAVSLSYDANLRVVAITDAIGQVTTISYDHPTDIFKITKVTDPFGRFATFEYDGSNRLIKVTDVIGLTSEFTYDVDGADGSKSDFIVNLKTPYGDTTFTKEALSGNTRSLETIYPDGDRDRIEYNQSFGLGIPTSEPAQNVPRGMLAWDDFLEFRNTYYWSKQAYAAAYPDYTKAKIYHWLHSLDAFPTTAGILESVKEPLEGRVWYDYAGQTGSSFASITVGNTNKPAHVGRVLDDGSTQLYTYEYNGFGNVTREVDPIGRTFSYIYAENGIDLLEKRQTRAGQNELFFKATYNAQHLPLTSTDAAGQTTTFTYNDRGQVLTKTNARNDTTTYVYDDNGHLISIDGPLPGSSITFTYDSVGRVRTKTDESGYTLTFDYDDLDRLTKITLPDGTFDEFTYTRLDHTLIQDRAGRKTTLEYNSIRQITKRADPLNRVTLFQWCKCGALKSLTDPMGRTTTWRHDIQGRLRCKEYADGSRVIYRYENMISHLSQKIDEKLQVTQYDYNWDDTLSRITYNNAAVATPPVAFTYDSNYSRLRSMTDGTGTTRYEYIPITPAPSLGAGQLARVDGPLPNDAIIFSYDELGRRVSTAINGVTASVAYDAAGRIIANANALGVFTKTYDGNSFRIVSVVSANGKTTEFAYGSNLQDRLLQRIAHKVNGTPISEFIYGHDVPTGQITSWSQQADAKTPSIYSLAYDAIAQLTAASVSEGGNVVKTFGYSYDFASNRLTEQVDATTREFSYNALNELTSVESDAGLDATYQWDAEQRLISVTTGNQNTEFAYDGLGRRVGIRLLVGSAEVSNRRFIWCDNEICEERTPAGIVSKRFFRQGMKVETGPTAGKYFYTRDHLGSVRELIDDAGSVRARFNYDLYGGQRRISGDLDVDFGFTGHFYHAGIRLDLTWFRAYDPEFARWLSRDPFPGAELLFGPNLYAYAAGDPINRVDFYGLMIDAFCQYAGLGAYAACRYVGGSHETCSNISYEVYKHCLKPRPGPPNLNPDQCSKGGSPIPFGPPGPGGFPSPSPDGPVSPDPMGGSGYAGGGGQSGGGGSGDSW